MSSPLLAAPWYVHPAADPAAWSALDRPPRPAFVVVNVRDGPGEQDDPYYPAVLDRVQARMIGYVDAAYGQRPPEHVAADMRRWRRCYPRVDGFMLDRVPTSPDTAEACDAYARAGRDLAGLLVANPGTTPPPEHLDLYDITCTFEGPAAQYVEYEPPAWLRARAPERVWHLVYASAGGDLDDHYERAAALGAGYAFVTDRDLPNPWAGPPLAHARHSGP